MRSGTIHLGKTIKINQKSIEFQRESGIRKNRLYEIKKLYKIIYNNGTFEVFNNYYYLEKNKSPLEFKTNLLPVRFFSKHYYYGQINSHLIGQLKFLQLVKKLDDSELLKLRRKFILLDVIDKTIIITGGLCFGAGVLLYQGTYNDWKHGYIEGSKGMYGTALGFIFTGIPVAITGIVLNKIKRTKQEQI